MPLCFYAALEILATIPYKLTVLYFLAYLLKT